MLVKDWPVMAFVGAFGGLIASPILFVVRIILAEAVPPELARIILWGALSVDGSTTDFDTLLVSSLAIAVPSGAILGIFKAIVDFIADERTQNAQREQDAQDALNAERNRLNEERNSLSILLGYSQSTFRTLQELLSAAHSHLDMAEQEFSEGAFAPFWDAVERAANKLGAHLDGVTQITLNATRYTARRSRLSVSIPEFSLPEADFPDARPVAARLFQIFRKGQKEYQFATIYQQRMTNQRLGTVIDRIEQQQHAITDALKDLSYSLGSRLDGLVQSYHAQTDLMSTLTEHIASNVAAQREFETNSLGEERKQSAMLDNIQRGRKPFP